MTKSRHPLAMDLRIWATKIESNLLTEEDVKTIAELLRRVADGEDFDDVLGVKRTANRPRRDATKHYVEQVYGLTQPVFNWRDQKEVEGMQVSRAIIEVARACNVSPDTVKTAFYSKEGREHLEHIKDRLKNPLS